MGASFIDVTPRASRRLPRDAMREEDDDASSSSIDEPEHLLCPITRAMFRDPVFVPASGNTYERAAVARFWSGSSRARDPLTNATLRSRSVYTNWDKRREVADWLTANPTTTPSGWDSRTPPAPEKWFCLLYTSDAADD